MSTGLERKAHRLVELARAGDDPSAAQLLSLHGAVAARIAAEGAGVAATATTSTKTGALLKSLVAAGAIAAGAVGFFALQSEPALPPAPSRAPAMTASRPAPLHPPSAVPAEAAAPSVAPPVVPARPSRPSNPSLRLQDEAALLAEVQGALRSGQAANALTRLDSYDRRFPAGMLRSEAEAARVFALCGAGRVDKARAAAVRFVAKYPNAPATARVQSACK